jgi:DNA-binding MarR family transcriptional regulator
MNDYVDELISSWRTVRSDIDTAPIAVIARILRAAQIIQLRLDAVIGAEAELSHKGDLDTLTALRRAGKPLSPSTLAQVGQLTSGGTTNRLDRLESAGLIARHPHPDDRRGVLVTLTADGSRLADEAFALSLQAQRELLMPLAADQQQAVTEALQALLVSLGDVPLGIQGD